MQSVKRMTLNTQKKTRESLKNSQTFLNARREARVNKPQKEEVFHETEIR